MTSPVNFAADLWGAAPLADHSDPSLIGQSIADLIERERAAKREFWLSECAYLRKPTPIARAEKDHARFEYLAAVHDVSEAIDRHLNPGSY